ncbi:MAG: hypothetical protein ACT4P7_24075, partial [Gemmatimonadaceae bacterium]
PAGAARDSALARFVAERPGGRARFAQRVDVGRDIARSAVVNLADPEGKTRIRMMVDSLGNPSLEFLDANGAVTSRLPR